MKILVVSHGAFAQGLVETVVDFFGGREIYHANVDLHTGNRDLIEKITEYIDNWDKQQILILTVLKGGSSTQSVLPFLERENVTIITGINLSVILQLSLLTNDHVSREELSMIIEEAKKDMSVL